MIIFRNAFFSSFASVLLVASLSACDGEDASLGANNPAPDSDPSAAEPTDDPAAPDAPADDPAEGADEPSEPTPSDIDGLPNPASVQCLDAGGTLDLVDGEGGQYGLCTFDDGSVCEEWALYRAECAPGACVAWDDAAGCLTDEPIEPIEPVEPGPTPDPVEPDPELAALCVATGGAVETAFCCASSSPFPNSCLVGACGCSLEYSVELEVCACPDGCFDPAVGCTSLDL